MIDKQVSPVLVEYIKDACTKVFWTHDALRLFLRQNGIAESFLSSWHKPETKRKFIIRLFDNLIQQKDNKGHAVVLKIGQVLSGMEYFPDLENYEDSPTKITAAQEAVRRVKEQIDKINKNIDAEDRGEINQRRLEERLKEIESKQQPFETLKSRLDELTPKIGTQTGGYEFEKWFYDLTVFNEIQAKRPYKDSNSRQIDGAITIDGTTFLIETKFENHQASVTDIDSFSAKVCNKADNTMGIMIAMSGFTEGAINEASKPGSKILLMDGGHIYNFILSQTMTLQDVVRRIKRHASQMGRAYLPASDFSKR